ncbi:phosphomannomutase/phosphoglucomutase [Neomoorella thermoacetica]|uniref:phosphomannomutase/phosphoglucomutase n=1 Tax=Neomoorella thermoacetica TaxID=1525 RepID=UPI0008FBB860|nr:phosphomannomutase/phosphoglucomutase [Moorella thermoacetica]OIQ52785.1 phosphomannomutase/phosphoglucomutase [Moorella thermoacetica]
MNPAVFKAYDIRGVADRDFPDGEVEKLGRSLGTYFQAHGYRQVVLARDNRRHSSRLRDAVVKGLTAAGCDCIDIGETITPVFYFAHHHLNLKAGVMITASHNPPQDNGFKVYCGEGTIFGAAIQEVRRIMERGEFKTGRGRVEEVQVEGSYIDYIASRIKLETRLRVVADGGNGTAGPVAVKLLQALGCRVIPLYCESDPAFPHHHPDPTVVENLVDLRQAVLDNKADLGVSFDGDGDRLGVIDDRGQVIWGDMLQILFWREIMPRYPGSTAIVEVKCSQTLVDEITRLGGRPFFYKTGHSLIKAKMRELGIPFTGEMSGHLFFADEYFGYDDALYAAARLLRIVAGQGRKLSELLADVPRLPITPEVRIPCPEKQKQAVISGITESFRREGYEVIDVDGARVVFPHGWGLIRASNTQEVLVLRCEAKSEGELAGIKKMFEEKIKSYIEEVNIAW